MAYDQAPPRREPPPAAVPSNAAGLPNNMYGKLLADYQTAATQNYGQQISSANRNKQELNSELARQQAEQRKQNGFWNRMKNSLANGVVNAVGQLPSAAIKAGATALGGPIGGMMASGAMQGGASSVPMAATDLAVGQNPYAQFMATGQMPGGQLDYGRFNAVGAPGAEPPGIGLGNYQLRY